MPMTGPAPQEQGRSLLRVWRGVEPMKSAAILFPVALLAPFQAFAATPATATGSAALAMFAGRWQLHGSFMAFGAKKPTHVTGVNTANGPATGTCSWYAMAWRTSR